MYAVRIGNNFMYYGVTCPEMNMSSAIFLLTQSLQEIEVSSTSCIGDHATKTLQGMFVNHFRACYTRQ